MCRLRETGVSGHRARGTGIKSKFTDTNDQVIDAYIAVRPDVIARSTRSCGRATWMCAPTRRVPKASCAARRG